MPNKPLANWQAPNCKLHAYKPRDVNKCMDGQSVLYVGDLSARAAFFESIRLSNASAADHPSIHERQSDMVQVVNGVTFAFVWDPFMDQNGVARLQDLANNGFHPGSSANNTGVQVVYIAFGREFLQKTNAQPSVSPKSDALSEFRVAASRIAPLLKRIAAARNLDGSSPKVVVSPVIEPYFQKAENNVFLQGLTPVRLQKLNQHLAEVFPLESSSIYLPQVFNMMSQSRPDAFSDDGEQLVPAISKLQADIVYNLACNTKISTAFPYANTCCLEYPRPAGFYFLTIAVLFLVPVSMAAYYAALHRGSVKALAFGLSEHAGKTQFAFLVMALSLIYCYLCDRTNVFAKGDKHFAYSEFTGLCLFFAVIGFATLRRVETKPSQLFLNRFQTDEWKGWMQIAILVYHITGGSRILPIYKVIRVMVASYLFMTGYGHATFFVAKADFSLKRFVSVMCRLNLLTIGLAYVMNTDYLFYYFSPLVSFWFCVIWATFRILPQYNAGLGSSLTKVAVSAAVSYLFIAVPGAMDSVFWVLRTVANVHWNLTEWRFRLLLDVWAVHFGMLVSILVHNPQTAFVYSSIPQRLGAAGQSLLMVAGGSVLIYAYFLVSQQYTAKLDYNHVHPFISLFPITGFILIRNAAPVSYLYSTAFAYVGKISLETFILQFHVWMASDTKAALYMIDMGLVPRFTSFVYTQDTVAADTSIGSHMLSGVAVLKSLERSFAARRYVNFLLVSVVFVVASQKVADASGVITSWFVKFGGAGADKGGKAPSKPKESNAEPLLTEQERKEGDGGSGAAGSSGNIQSEMELGEIGKDKRTEEVVEVTNTGASPSNGLSSMPLSNVAPIRIVQKLGILVSKFMKSLSVRVGVVMVLLWVLNLVW